MARWPASTEHLIRAQEALGVSRPPAWRPGGAIGSVGGCFVCFPRGTSGRGAPGDRAWAAAVLVCEGRLAATSVSTGSAGAAYEAGLLALREGSILEAAVRGLPEPPEVLLVNATGRDHPRRAGLALHLGAVLEVPTVGVTNRTLVARGEWPADRRGATASLLVEGEVVGSWLRTRRGTRPLAVHAAWRTDPETAVLVVLDTTARARGPEPIRQARRLAREARARAR